MALSKIQNGYVDTNAIGATELNLADNYTFTGDVSGAGNLLQVVQQTVQPTSNYGVNTTSYSNTGLMTLTITPTAANSKILVEFHGFIMHVNVQAGNYGGSASIYRDVAGGGYNSVSGSTYGLTGYYRNNQTTDHWDDWVSHMDILDTPTYTVGQTISYQIWGKNAARNTSGMYMNHVGGIPGGNGSGIIMIRGRATEIAG